MTIAHPENSRMFILKLRVGKSQAVVEGSAAI
jgi:hypothetical protein